MHRLDVGGPGLKIKTKMVSYEKDVVLNVSLGTAEPQAVEPIASASAPPVVLGGPIDPGERPASQASEAPRHRRGKTRTKTGALALLRADLDLAAGDGNEQRGARAGAPARARPHPRATRPASISAPASASTRTAISPRPWSSSSAPTSSAPTTASSTRPRPDRARAARLRRGPHRLRALPARGQVRGAPRAPQGRADLRRRAEEEGRQAQGHHERGGRGDLRRRSAVGVSPSPRPSPSTWASTSILPPRGAATPRRSAWSRSPAPRRTR